MYQYSVNQEGWNVSLLSWMDDLWPLFEGHINSYIQTTALKTLGQCDHVSYLAFRNQDNKNLFSWFSFVDGSHKKKKQPSKIFSRSLLICPYILKYFLKTFLSGNNETKSLLITNAEMASKKIVQFQFVNKPSVKSAEMNVMK